MAAYETRKKALGLIDFAEAPFRCTVLAPTRRCSLTQSPLLGALRALTA